MIDRYTKVCLTVIAVSLAVIGLRGMPLIDPAWAGILTPFEATPDQCAEVKVISGRFLSDYFQYAQPINSKGKPIRTLHEDMMINLSKTERFAAIYNAFCKD